MQETGARRLEVNWGQALYIGCGRARGSASASLPSQAAQGPRGGARLHRVCVREARECMRGRRWVERVEAVLTQRQQIQPGPALAGLSRL